ncbi:MAG: NAD(P)H-binding protein [Eubacteriales bacterium]|nr:NAD(P)H-binding protein [Eubacteriales bacterium]
MNKVLLTGVDGNFGKRAAKALMEKLPKEQLIFTAPNKEALKEYEKMGIETRYADFNHPDQLAEAFQGAHTVCLISMPFVGPRRRTAHKNAVDACVKDGADRIVYTSIVGAGLEECDTYEVSDHKYTEAYIREQPIHYVFIRDAQYAEAMVSAFEEAYDNTNGVLSNNMGEGRMAYISRDDCALAAACVAAGAGGNDVVYELSGAEALTITEYLAIASEVTGKKVTYHEITDEEMYEYFDSIGVPRTTEEMWANTAKNYPFCSDGMVTFGRAIRLNQMNTFTHDFEKLTGQKPMTVREIFENMDAHRIGSRTSTDK